MLQTIYRRQLHACPEIGCFVLAPRGRMGGCFLVFPTLPLPS